jgi:hypothetical protein
MFSIEELPGTTESYSFNLVTQTDLYGGVLSTTGAVLLH